MTPKNILEFHIRIETSSVKCSNSLQNPKGVYTHKLNFMIRKTCVFDEYFCSYIESCHSNMMPTYILEFYILIKTTSVKCLNSPEI